MTTPFDLDRGPLFRALLATADRAPWRLALMAHHVVCDGWSFGVLIRELAEAYRAASDAALPAAPS